MSTTVAPRQRIVTALLLLACTASAQNVVENDGFFYAALGREGFAVIDGFNVIERRGNRSHEVFDPADGAGSVDDLAVADGFLFALDAKDPASLTVFSLEDPLQPEAVAEPRAVAVNGYGGVSAGNGSVVVAGGTSPLTVFKYDRKTGKLSNKRSNGVFGGAHNDVLLSSDGARAYVSADSIQTAARFAISTVKLGEPKDEPKEESRTPLEGFGLTGGALKPANFPMSAALFDDERGGHRERFVLVAGGPGVAFVLVTDPREPRHLGTAALNVSGLNVAVLASERKAYAVGSSPRAMLMELDLDALPLMPAPGATVNLQKEIGDRLGGVTCQATSVAVSDDVIAVSANDCGVVLLARSSMELLGTLEHTAADALVSYDADGDVVLTKRVVSTQVEDDEEEEEGEYQYEDRSAPSEKEAPKKVGFVTGYLGEEDEMEGYAYGDDYKYAG